MKLRIKESSSKFSRRRPMRRMNEETMWNKVEPSAVQAARKILTQNGIDILDVYEKEDMSYSGGDTNIQYVTVFVTDIPCADFFDERPGNLRRITSKIENAVGDRYNVFTSCSDRGTWEILITKYI